MSGRPQTAYVNRIAIALDVLVLKHEAGASLTATVERYARERRLTPRYVWLAIQAERIWSTATEEFLREEGWFDPAEWLIAAE